MSAGCRSSARRSGSSTCRSSTSRPCGSRRPQRSRRPRSAARPVALRRCSAGPLSLRRPRRRDDGVRRHGRAARRARRRRGEERSPPRFVGAPLGDVTFVRTVERPDQWTLLLRRELPLEKFAVATRRHGGLRFADRGAVVLATTARSRGLAWIATIPHWFYFTALRTNQPLWYWIVVRTSAARLRARRCSGWRSASCNSASRRPSAGRSRSATPAGCAGTTSPAPFSACSRSPGSSAACCRWSRSTGPTPRASMSTATRSPAGRSS